MYPEGCILSLSWAPVQARKGADLTVNAWRPQGCGAESCPVEETGYVFSTENTSQFDFEGSLWQK